MYKRTIRPIRIEGKLAYITLTKGYEAIVNACDAALVENYNWLADVHTHRLYALTNKTGRGKGKIRMHNLIMPPKTGFVVDHINGNGFDNRRENLRIVTPEENALNRKKYTNNKSGFKGVYWHKRIKKWGVEIRAFNKRKHIGYFCCPKDARDAYINASIEMHGAMSRFL